MAKITVKANWFEANIYASIEEMLNEERNGGDFATESFLKEGLPYILDAADRHIHRHQIINVLVNEVDRLRQRARDQEAKPSDTDTPIEALDLGVRAFNTLKKHDINLVSQVMDFVEKGDDALLALDGFGEYSLKELKLQLFAKGLITEAPGKYS